MSLCFIQFYPLTSHLHSRTLLAHFTHPSLLAIPSFFFSRKKVKTPAVAIQAPPQFGAGLFCTTTTPTQSGEASGQAQCLHFFYTLRTDLFSCCDKKIHKNKLYACTLTKMVWHWTKGVYYSNAHDSERDRWKQCAWSTITETLRVKYFYSPDLEKATRVEVGAHDMGAFGSLQWKKLKENRFSLPEASWAETAKQKRLNWVP